MTDAEIRAIRDELIRIAAELLLGAVKRPRWPAYLPTYIWTRVNKAWDAGDEKMKQLALRVRDVANRLPQDARIGALEALAHHLRHCRECGEMDVMHCYDGKLLWSHAGMPADPTSGQEG